MVCFPLGVPGAVSIIRIVPRPAFETNTVIISFSSPVNLGGRALSEVTYRSELCPVSNGVKGNCTVDTAAGVSVFNGLTANTTYSITYTSLVGTLVGGSVSISYTTAARGEED